MLIPENTLTQEIIGAALEVHRALGPGLLESAYQRCLEIEFTRSGLLFERQKTLGLEYRGQFIPEVYRLDFVVQGLVVVEVKAVQRWDPIFDAQLLTYLKLTDLHVGLFINFHAPMLKDGIRRMVLNLPTDPVPSSAPSAPLR